MRRVAVLVVVLLLVAPAARASHLPNPVVAEDAGDGGRWAAYRFAVEPGTTVEWEALGTLLDARVYGTGGWLLGPGGKLETFILFTGYSGITNEVRIHGPDPVGVVSQGYNDGMFGAGGASAAYTFNVSKEYIFVVAFASDGVVSSQLRLYASEGFTLLDRTSGSETFMRTETDFQGGAMVHASGCAVRFYACGKAKASVENTAVASAARAMFGQFGAGGVEGSRLSHSTPATPRAEGGAVFTNGPAGQYGFTVHLNAGSQFSGLSAWGADVALP